MTVDLGVVIPRVYRRFRNEVAESREGEKRVENWLAGVSFKEWFALIEAKQQLHRRAQEAERDLAKARREGVELLVKKLADVSHERHLYQLENGFMKRERERLKARIRELEPAAEATA